VSRSDDPTALEEMLSEAGLRLDRRGEFPRRNESVAVAPEQPVPAFLLAPMRRGLAESVDAAARAPKQLRLFANDNFARPNQLVVQPQAIAK